MSDFQTVAAAYACVAAAVAGYVGYLAYCQAHLRRRMAELRRIRAARAVSGPAAG